MGERVRARMPVVRHRVGAVTTPGRCDRRLVSSHHNLMRFALKCFPARDAARVLAGELLRLPRHPRLVGPALWQVGRELPRRTLRRERTTARSRLRGD